MSYNNTPEISVLLSTHNNENSINNSIKSIINQSFEDFELLIMNDASDDTTLKELKNFDDKRIKIFNNRSNLGLTKSLNLLLAKSSGKYIARQDADDISLKDRFKIQKKYIKNNNLKFCSARARSMHSNKKIPGVSFYIPEKVLLKYKNPHIHGTLFMEKKILEEVGGYDENFYFAQDFKLYCDLIKKNIQLARINKILYLMNTKDNISNKNKDEQRYYFECAKNNILPKVN